MGDFLRDPVTLWTIPRFLLVAWVKLRLPWPRCLVAVSRAGGLPGLDVLTCNYCSVQWKYCWNFTIYWFVLFVCLSFIWFTYSILFYFSVHQSILSKVFHIWWNCETGLSPHASRFLVQARGDAPLLSPTLDESLHLLGFRAHSQT